MAEKTLNDKTVEVTDEGYLTDHARWDKEMAPELAKSVGIDSLTDDHWKVITFLQNEYKANGAVPTLRAIGKKSGVGMKDIYQLFPDGPVKKAALIAGLPKPESCV